MSRDGRGSTYWDWNINTNLTGLNVLGEARCGWAGAGEDRGTVAVFVLVDHVDSIVNGWDVQADKDWSEDLLLVALHVWLDVANDGWADLSTLISLQYADFKGRYSRSCRWGTSLT